VLVPRAARYACHLAQGQLVDLRVDRHADAHGRAAVGCSQSYHIDLHATASGNPYRGRDVAGCRFASETPEWRVSNLREIGL
jgi:hypothetical protein